MNISVQGLRTSLTDWEAAKNLPREQLPPLSQEQREVARKLRVPEEDYARSAFAGQRTMERMVAKTERLARYLVHHLSRIAPEARVETVVLNTWDGLFEVTLLLGRHSIPVRIAEELVDDYFDSGSPDMEKRLERVLNLALQGQVA